MVGAWSASASMNLAQVPTQENSNEMIPGLLDLLDLRGCLVSIDAMSDGHWSKDDQKSEYTEKKENFRVRDASGFFI